MATEPGPGGRGGGLDAAGVADVLVSLAGADWNTDPCRGKLGLCTAALFEAVAHRWAELPEEVVDRVQAVIEAAAPMAPHPRR